MAYETTTVPVERSQGEIRKLLTAHSATSFGFGEDIDLDGQRWAAVSFVVQNARVRLRVPHKPIDRAAVGRKLQKARTKTAADIRGELEEQEAKRIWRVMAWNLKARLVAVEEGVETFEEAFLAHLVLPGHTLTVYEQLRESGTIELGGGLLQLTRGDG